MFQLTEMTQATIASVTPRVEKHGDEDKPAVSIKLSIEGPNTLLDAIDTNIRHALYKAKPDDTPELEGIEQSTPILRCNSFERHTLATSHEGWTLAVDNDIDDTAPMKFGGCKVDKFAVEAKQGGSIVLTIRVGTSDIDADRLGWLGMHNGESIWITLTPPEKPAEAIDGTTGHPGVSGPTAEDLFAADEDEDDCEPEDDEDAGPELEDRLDNALRAADAESAGQASKDALDASGNNPFGHSDEPAPGPTRPARTDRGYRKTRDAIAQGMAEAKAAGLA